LSCLEIQGGNQSAKYQTDLPGLSAWVSCRPLQPATRGGDLYYLTVCRRGNISRVAIADVEGHGESVSGVADRLRDALRDHAEEWDQSELIRQLNDGFLKGARHGQFATALLLSHYVDTGEILFTNAGHMPPMWRKATLGEWIFLEDATPFSKQIDDMPLGMIPGAGYRQTAVQLAPGDLLVLYTDGVNEARDTTGEQLGMERLLEMAKGLPTGSAEAAGEALLAGLARFRDGAPSGDDETIIVLHCLARAEETNSQP
jgi:sigma-B regulation protein RsbU (phosphoserine phosphatase)